MSENMHSLGSIQQPRLVNLLDAVTEQFDEVLFPATSLQLIRSLTKKLPLTNSLLFELRMLESDSTVDLSLPFPENFTSSLLKWSSLAPWDGIISLYCACQSRELAGYMGSHVFWFEFDSDQMLQPIPIPGVFLDISPELSQPENRSFLAQLMCRAAFILKGQKVPQSTQQGLKNLLNTLPQDVCCTHFGVMLSRMEENAPVSSIRVNFGRWQRAEHIFDWLETIGCNTVALKISPVIKRIPHLFDKAIVTLDISASVGLRIGLECYPTSIGDVDSTSQQNGRWLVEFTDWLREQSLASKQKVQALFNWDSDITVPKSLGFERESLSNYSVFEANLSHIKLVFEPQSLQAKAYLLTNFMAQDEIESKSVRSAFESFTQIWEAR